MSHAGQFDRGIADRSASSRDSPTITTSRHLSAIFAADVAGYSRLMGADEEGTLNRLKAHRRQLVDPKITEHHGRIVKTTGDGMLVEFSSVVDAVRCAVEMQRAMVDRNAETVEEKRITFRIGINLGDVIADGDDIYGDGVNIAARLEALAEPGGICISGTVRDHIRDKLPYAFEDMGEQSVKNIARPVRVYAMDLAAVASMPLVGALLETSPGRSRSPKHFLIAASIVAAVGLGIAVWWVWPPGGSSTAPIQIPVAVGPQSSPAPTTTGATGIKAASIPRLSIVVLPFSNLSNDPDQEYFVDAITDDLTTDLSRISDSFVIARNTAFTYKGKAVDAKQIARELGVRYVLEGSMRRMGDRAQVNVQLIDGETGAHLWADRFETDRRNLADAQTEITGRLARTLHLELVSDVARRIEADRVVDPDARDLVMRGWVIFYRAGMAGKSGAREEARRDFERALEIDPRSIDARVGLAMILNANIGDGSSNSIPQDKVRAGQLLVEAIERDPSRSLAHGAMGVLRRFENRLVESQVELEKAVALDQNDAWALRNLGMTLMFQGKAEPAIPYVEKAIRLSPREPTLFVAYMVMGKCNLFLGHVDVAIDFLRKAVAERPGSWLVHMKLAGALGLRGDIDEARAEIAESLKLKPEMNSVARFRAIESYQEPGFQARHDKTIVLGLRRAGFPEEVAAQ
jgi:adenylate cyclase